MSATKQALRTLPRRYQRLDDEAGELDQQMRRLVLEVAPALVVPQGISTHTAATLLTTAGDKPHRLASESSFAYLSGVAPLDASSGKQQRHG